VKEGLGPRTPEMGQVHGPADTGVFSTERAETLEPRPRVVAALARLKRGAGEWLWILGALLLFGMVGVAAFRLPPSLLLAMVGASVIALVWLIIPEAVAVVLLLGRATVDGFMELFTLFAGSPLSMNLSGAVNSLAVGLGLLAVLRRLVRRQSLLVAGPGKAYTLFLLVCLLSIPGSVDPAGGIKEWARLASGLAVCFLVADVVHDERGARRFTVVILGSSVLPLLLAWMQKLAGRGYFFLGFVGTEFAYRPQGTFAHPAALGSYLVILLTLCICIFFSGVAPWVRSALVGWAAAAGGALALALARTEWLGMLTAILVVGMLKRRRVAVLALLLAIALFATVPLLRERLTASDSVSWRLNIWQASQQLLWPPRLLGWGLASSPWHINMLLPKVATQPHNDYLKIGIELGVLGMLTYLGWSLVTLRHAWRAYRQAPEAMVSWRALGLFAVVLAGMVMSLSDNYLSYTAVQWYLWAVIALVPANGVWPVTSQRSLRFEPTHSGTETSCN